MLRDDNNQFLSTAELAKILGVSRVTVFQKIKKGKIEAERVGRNFIINRSSLPEILKEIVGDKDKKQIEKAIKKTVKDYGETLRLLGKE